MIYHTKVYVYENNGGGITAIVKNVSIEINKDFAFKDEAVANILFGFEEAILPYAEFIAAAREGFPDADSYVPGDFSGLSINEAAEEIEQEDVLIAEITAQRVIIYPRAMGIAGEILFGLSEE